MARCKNVMVFALVMLAADHRGGGFAADALQADEYLGEVGVGALEWDSSLDAYARQYGESKAGSCRPLRHSEGAYGENLYWSSRSATPGDVAVAAWVEEEQVYDYPSNSCAQGQACGHYTQVVWRDTTNVGCASVACDDGGTFIICSYNPPGNVVGQKPY